MPILELRPLVRSLLGLIMLVIMPIVMGVFVGVASPLFFLLRFLVDGRVFVFGLV